MDNYPDYRKEMERMGIRIKERRVLAEKPIYDEGKINATPGSRIVFYLLKDALEMGVDERWINKAKQFLINFQNNGTDERTSHSGI